MHSRHIAGVAKPVRSVSAAQSQSLPWCWLLSCAFSKNIKSIRKTEARISALASGLAVIGKVAPKLSAFVNSCVKETNSLFFEESSLHVCPEPVLVNQRFT